MHASLICRDSDEGESEVKQKTNEAMVAFNLLLPFVPEVQLEPKGRHKGTDVTVTGDRRLMRWVFLMQNKILRGRE